MNIEYRSLYFDDPTALAAFHDYAISVFGADFTLWREKGFWDDEYVAFSAFVDGLCIATICVYPSEITFGGKVSRWAQLHTVGTRPEYRKMGIQRQLWQRTQAWIAEQFDTVFLYTDETAAGFYEKLGLKRHKEFFDVSRNVTGAVSEKRGFRKLDMDNPDDLSIVTRLAFEREPVSNLLGFRNPKLLMYMFLYELRDWTYYIESLDAVVVVEETESAIRVHDVIAKSMPLETDLEAFLGTFKASEIHWLFCTDRLVLSPVRKEPVTEDVLIVSPNFETDQQLLFPYSIRA